VYFGPASQINYREVLISVEKLFDKPTELTEMSRRGLSLVSRFSKELVKEIFD
jgi:hypothetical protein